MPGIFFMLQHPFADLRGFVGDPRARLRAPRLPMPNAGEFIRSSGNARRRPRGGVADWAGEESYVSAHHAFRFANRLESLTLGRPQEPAAPTFALRRLLSDGRATRLEIGLKLSLTAHTWGPIKAENGAAILRDALRLPVRIRVAQEAPRAYPLVAAGPALARHYLHATTGRQVPPAQAPAPWWFKAGSPMLLVESNSWEALELPPHSRVVMQLRTDPQATDDAAFEEGLAHCWLQIDGVPCSTWFIAKNNAPAVRERVRRLRLHLLRLHAERECLRLLLQSIRDGDLDYRADPDISNAVQDYINTTLRLTEKPERYGTPQAEILDVARHATGLVLEDYNASLTEMRRQVALKVQRFIQRSNSKAHVTNNYWGNVMNTTITLGHVSVTGDFNLVTAANITNSFNKAAAAEAKPELKEKLKDLSIQAAELARQLPEERAEQVSNDLHTLTSEALAKAPRKSMLDISAKGLIEAAGTLAKMAAPVTVAVKAVLGLLVP